MYYVFKSSFEELSSERNVARLENAPDNFFPDMASGEPLAESLPKLNFSIPSGTQLLDNHVTSSSLDLYSNRLITLLRNNGVRFESFNTTIVSRKSQEILEDDHHIFHLLEPFNALDQKMSILSKRKITKLVISEELVKSQKLMVRDNYRRSLVFIRKDLKDILDKNKISGCYFKAVDSYRLGWLKNPIRVNLAHLLT